MGGRNPDRENIERKRKRDREREDGEKETEQKNSRRTTWASHGVRAVSCPNP